MKKLMLLGGIRTLIPVIETAHKLGYYVITCDYLPNNIAHQYSDEYHNVSIIDKEAVLRVAQELHIDGIMSFAVDPGVVAAAYVQQQMQLPAFGPYQSVCILQNKDLFRQFLKDNGFNTPWALSFSSVEEALQQVDLITYPAIVKPTDSAGSKGVSRVDTPEELMQALTIAFNHSIKKQVIVEEFIEKIGCSSDADSIALDGELKVVDFSAQRFDTTAANPYTPSAHSWPSTFTPKQEQELRSELQRLITLLGMKSSVYNVEARIGTNGKPYIMEVSPRGGGNRLAEMLRFSTGIDLIEAACRAAVGDEVGDLTGHLREGHWSLVVLHSDKEGTFHSLKIAKEYRERYVKEVDLWVKPGDPLNAFRGANDAIGTLVLQFPTAEELEQALSHQKEWIEVVLR